MLSLGLDLLAQQCFCQQGEHFFNVRLAETSIQTEVDWKIYQGKRLICQGKTNIHSLEEVGNYYYQGKRYSERKLDFSSYLSNDDPTQTKTCLATGYYQIAAQIALNETHVRSNKKQCSAEAELIVYPKQSYSINKKCWGISAQLYTLVSDDNLGIGDFNDLQLLIRQCAEVGADYILLNPLHALFEDQAERASPYSPSDRFCLNPIYIHIQHCPEYQNNPLAQKLLAKLLAKASGNDAVYLDYEEIYRDKYSIFLALFRQFKLHESPSNSQRYQDFQKFKKQNNQRIDSYSQWLISRGNLSENYAEIEFIHYLQWLAQEQLSQCQRLAIASGMAIGLIKDLAVGCSQDGNEFSSHQALFVAQASIGAPPDPWAPAGQNWGLPPIDPIKLKANGFQHFRQLLRENMRDCGALRIDHVMALMRLWWCPLIENLNKNNKQSGCYVYYPFEQLLAILTLESELNQCALIGEDLGVVPAEIKYSLAEADMLSNDLFYFAKDAQGQFIDPDKLPSQTLMMIANHDVATFSAWWQKHDLTLRQELRLFTEQEQFLQEKQQRQEDKVNLLFWLNKYSEAGEVFDLNAEAKRLYQALVLVLAQTKVNWLTLQLDDLANEILPVNIPGTDTEYPNWRRRLHCNTAELFNDKGFFLTLTQLRTQQ